MILNMVPEKQLYSELRSLEPWPGKKRMGRPQDKAWKMVHRPTSKTWICPHCLKSFKGGVTRVKHHLARIPGGDICLCSKVPRDVWERAQHFFPRAAAVTARPNESPIQMNEIRQMQTQYNVIPTQVQPVAFSHPVGELNHQNENCAEATYPQQVLEDLPKVPADDWSVLAIINED